MKEKEDLSKAFEPYGGWWIGRVDGKSWFTDGSAMFEGMKKTERKPLKKKAMQKMVNAARREKLAPIRIFAQGKIGGFVYLKIYIFNNGEKVQKKYVDYALQRGAEFFAGPKSGELERQVVCKVGRKIIGLILPVSR